MVNKKFELKWAMFIQGYGKSFGRFYNGLKRRKAIAEIFYLYGAKDTYQEVNNKVQKKIYCKKCSKELGWNKVHVCREVGR